MEALATNMIQLRTNRKKPDLVTYEIKDFKGASNKLLDEARVAKNEAVEALNLIQVQDGLWKPRWGTGYYGQDLGATVDGAAEYVTDDLTTELIAIAGGKAYKSQDGGTWTELTGATFTAGNQCYFMQIAGFLYIANGVDSLVRYNGTNLSTYSEIDAPANLSGTKTGLTGTNYTMYAEVTALNDVGETVGSTEASVQIGKARDQWIEDTDYITWSWDAVVGATRYQLYVADESGDASFLVSTTNTSFADKGTVAINPYVQPPLQNTTAAPKFKSMVVSGNRIWATNDPNAPYQVYFSGTGTFMGVFSEFYGGGWINLEKGGREIPVSVVHYQSGQGEGRATVLCKTPEGKGAVWQISITTATVGDTSFSVPSAVKVVGSSGTESQLSVVADNNNILFMNRKGVFALGPQQNYFGILRTNELSAKIRPYIKSLIGSKIKDICSYFYDGKIFFSVPTNASGNNRIIILDTERNNWVCDWSIGAKQFLEYTDSTGRSRFLYVPLSGTRMIELSENIAGDLGEAFDTDYQSGRIPLAKLWKDFVKLNKVYVKLGSPRGTIRLEVSGSEKKSGFKAIASKTISPTASLTGMGFDLMGDFLMGDTNGTPTTFADSADIRYVKIRKKIRDVKLRITSSTIDTDYIIQGFILEGERVRSNPPSTWKV